MSATYEAGWTNATSTGKLYQRSGLHGSTGNAGSNVSGWTFVRNVYGANGSDTFTVTHAKSSFTGTNSVNGPWWSSKIVFSNGYGVAADTRVENFDWNKCGNKKVTPASDKLDPPSCTTTGKLSVLAQPTGVVVKVNSNTVTPPWSTSTPGSYNVVYSAASGYELTSNPSGTRVVQNKLDPNTNPDCRPDAPQPKREERPKTGSPDCAALTYDSWKEERYSKVEWDSSTKTYKHVWSDNWTEVQGSRVTSDVTNPQLCDMGLTVTANASCATATITLRNRSPWIYPVSYREVMQGDPVPTVGSPDNTGPYGPVVDNRGSAPNDQTKSKTFTYPEDSGTHVIFYAVRAGTEDVLWKDKPAGELKSITVKTDCEPNQVPLPADQTWVDGCNPPGVTNNVEWTDSLPASDEDVTWTESADGTTRTATYNDPNGIWKDGTSGPKVWTLPADSGELCPATVIQPPVVPVVDECGPGNAHYGPVPVGPWTSVVNPDGSVTITANPGNIFPSGPSVTSPVPVDSNVPCPTTTPPPVPPTPTCPNGTPWTDTNGNGMMDECDTPVPPAKPKKVKAGIEKVNKCETAADRYWLKKAKGVKYTVVLKKDGRKTVKHFRGGWHKTHGATVVKVKAVAMDGYKIKGKKLWTLKFTNKACPKPPKLPPNTGVRLVA